MNHNIYWIMLIIFMWHHSSIQAQSPIGTHYQFVVEAPLYLCDIEGNQIGNKQYIAPLKANFTYIESKDSKVIIRFWNWSKESKKVIPYNYTDSTQLTRAYFLLDKKFLETNVKRKYSKRPTFTTTTVVLPAKLRFPISENGATIPFRFSSDIALKQTFGIKHRINAYTEDNFHNLLVGVGLSSVNIDIRTGLDSTTVNQNIAAFTISLGSVWQFSQTNIGFYVGWDYINNSKSPEFANWKYQGKPWLSIGIGYAFYSPKNKSLQTVEGKNKP